MVKTDLSKASPLVGAILIRNKILYNLKIFPSNVLITDRKKKLCSREMGQNLNRMLKGTISNKGHTETMNL